MYITLTQVGTGNRRSSLRDNGDGTYTVLGNLPHGYTFRVHEGGVIGRDSVPDPDTESEVRSTAPGDREPKERTEISTQDLRR